MIMPKNFTMEKTFHEPEQKRITLADLDDSNTITCKFDKGIDLGPRDEFTVQVTARISDAPKKAKR